MLESILADARDTITVKRVYGEPVHEDGTLLIPAAKVRGAVGGGSGEGPDQQGKGAGGGFGVSARPVGMFVVKEGQVTWVPAVDVNRIVLVAGLVTVAALCAIGRPLAKAFSTR